MRNARDARPDGQPVRVRFIFGKLDPESASPYIESLRSHVQAKESGVKADVVKDPDEPMSFVAVEDFGTRGLRGDPTHDDEESGAAAGERNDFYYFWRNLGRSGKEKRSGAGGAWAIQCTHRRANRV